MSRARLARKAAVLASLEREAESLTTTPFGIGHIAIGCALSYLDFRFAEDNWRKGHLRLANWHAAFAARPSVRATQPVDDSKRAKLRCTQRRIEHDLALTFVLLDQAMRFSGACASGSTRSICGTTLPCAAAARQCGRSDGV